MLHKKEAGWHNHYANGYLMNCIPVLEQTGKIGDKKGLLFFSLKIEIYSFAKP